MNTFINTKVKNLTLCRLFLYIHEIHNIAGLLSRHNEYLELEIISGEPLSLSLSYSILTHHINVPLSDATHHRLGTMSVTPVHSLRMFSFFAENTSVNHKLTGDSGLKRFLDKSPILQICLHTQGGTILVCISHFPFFFSFSHVFFSSFLFLFSSLKR